MLLVTIKSLTGEGYFFVASIREIPSSKGRGKVEGYFHPSDGAPAF